MIIPPTKKSYVYGQSCTLGHTGSMWKDSVMSLLHLRNIVVVLLSISDNIVA